MKSSVLSTSGLTKHKVRLFKTQSLACFVLRRVFSIIPMQEMIATVTAEVEGLKVEPRKAKAEAAELKAADEQAAAELTLVITDRDKHEARVAEVQQELKDGVTKCEDLEQKGKD